jgi:hypothetical protein
MQWAFFVPRRPSNGRRKVSVVGVTPLQRVLASFSGANPHHVINRRDEDLAVADATGLCGLSDGFYDSGDEIVFDDDFELYLRKEVHDVLRSTIELGVPALTTETLYFTDSDALDTDGAKGFFHFIEFERLDDCFDFFHDFFLLKAAEPTTAALGLRGPFGADEYSAVNL